MYELVRTLIDDGLMTPQRAPFVTLAIVILIAVAVVRVLGGSDEEEEDD